MSHRRLGPPVVASTVVLVLLCVAAADRPAYDPTDRYDRRSVEGWTVYVNRELSGDHPDTAAKVLDLLRAKLADVARAVPAPAVAKLRDVPIWVEWRSTKFTCCCYHPSANWLRDNGVNPDKAGGVEVANARRFLAWERDQPWMVLHELAHAYHHRVVGHDHAGVNAAYDAAVKAGTYDRALHIGGKTTRHYALTSREEYFAEATEAFFGTNDFYPFVRAELRRHDPRLFELLGQLWGVGEGVRGGEDEEGAKGAAGKVAG